MTTCNLGEAVQRYEFARVLGAITHFLLLLFFRCSFVAKALSLFELWVAVVPFLFDHSEPHICAPILLDIQRLNNSAG